MMERKDTLLDEKIAAAFAEKSQRKTRPRHLIAQRVSELAASGADFTVDDLWHDLCQHKTHLGRATVYRSVELLVQAGLLDRVEFADGTHHYRVCGGTHHHHLTCTQCHRVVEVDLCLAPELMAAISQQTHFTIEGHALALYGRCEHCRTPG